jgi:hypothetical protein
MSSAPVVWSSAAPCYGCLLVSGVTARNQAGTLCTHVTAPPNTVSGSGPWSRRGGRGMCRLWTDDLRQQEAQSVPVPVERMFVGAAACMPSLSRAVRVFTGARAMHQAPPPPDWEPRVVIVVLEDGLEPEEWLVAALPRGATPPPLLPFAQWAPGRVHGFVPGETTTVLWRPCFGKREATGPNSARGAMCPVLSFSCVSLAGGVMQLRRSCNTHTLYREPHLCLARDCVRAVRLLGRPRGVLRLAPAGLKRPRGLAQDPDSDSSTGATVNAPARRRLRGRRPSPSAASYTEQGTEPEPESEPEPDTEPHTEPDTEEGSRLVMESGTKLGFPAGGAALIEGADILLALEGALRLVSNSPSAGGAGPGLL